jgi:hypothetical protein
MERNFSTASVEVQRWTYITDAQRTYLIDLFGDAGYISSRSIALLCKMDPPYFWRLMRGDRKLNLKVLVNLAFGLVRVKMVSPGKTFHAFIRVFSLVPENIRILNRDLKRKLALVKIRWDAQDEEFDQSLNNDLGRLAYHLEQLSKLSHLYDLAKDDPELFARLLRRHIDH